jgi:hypothetical protein
MWRLRSHFRVQLDLPVVFRWRDRSGRHQAEGVTRDISAAGVFVLSEVFPPVSAIIRCEVLIPSLDVQAQGSLLEVIAVGHVVRAGESNGFAVRSKKFVLRDLQA